ncbi:adenylate/guanylate cyclase domain-containing protein [Methylobacterium oryzisoli]|uniref:adenylate/guanylate cyclase domain-containing protein n=1 Tax=Methylobacterium oryzisoli TaxID=3385502 RepID=UPI003891F571
MSEPALLVVDDDDNNRFTLVQRLKREGYGDVALACDGREALALLAARPFDLVLLDVMMPELDGIGVLTAMKGDAALRHIPVIMISAVSDVDRVVRCIELGAEDYLQKPFNKVLLRARVGACLEKKRLRDQEQAHLAQIERQRGRLSELLHAILPAPAVSELEASGRVEPRRHPEVMVLFCDVVEFTAYCDAHAPETVLAHLQHLVVAFDDLAAEFNLEKIKTIGDAFMATGGLLVPNSESVLSGIACAFALIEAARAGPAGWELRCGLHVGPVVAGVVGRSKFSFDLWGDTVNVAARLAKIGEPGCVHLSEAAWRRVGSRCDVQAMGALPMRGKGVVPVYRCEAEAARHLHALATGRPTAPGG